MLRKGYGVESHLVRWRGLDTVTVIDDRFEYGETRYQTLGLLKARVIMVVHTESETVIRIISARKANKYEEEIYFREISD